MATPTSRPASNKKLDDDSDKSEVDEESQGEDDGMEFRLFASDDTPTAIVLNAKEPEIIYVHRERPPLDESPGSERMRQIAEAAIDAKTVLEQSHIPWVSLTVLSGWYQLFEGFQQMRFTNHIAHYTSQIGSIIFSTQSHSHPLQARSRKHKSEKEQAETRVGEEGQGWTDRSSNH